MNLSNAYFLPHKMCTLCHHTYPQLLHAHSDQHHTNDLSVLIQPPVANKLNYLDL
jgi:hypothetical protein